LVIKADSLITFPGRKLITAAKNIFVIAGSGDIFRLNSADGSIKWHTKVIKGLGFRYTVASGRLLYDPIYNNQQAGIWVINAANGNIKNIIKKSDINGVGFNFIFPGPIAVQQPYLIKEGTGDIYAVKL
jgi:outer membrane protein assembly factor BamB